MNQQQLQYFIEAVHLGSFQRVADANFVSQRAVSKQILNLETELDTKLFLRDSNRIRLTDVGHQFVPHAQDILNRLEDVENEFKHHHFQALDTVKIGYFSPFESQIMIDNINRFQAQAKQPLNFEVSEAGIEHLLTDVSIGILDCAYILAYGPHWQLTNHSLASQTIYQNEMILGVSTANPLAHHQEITPDDLKGHNVLYYSYESSSYLQNEFNQAINFSENISTERVSTIEQMQIRVALNHDVAFYPNGLFQRFIQPNNQIKYLPFKDPDTQKYSIQVVYQRRNKARPLRKFLDSLHSLDQL
ncbi:LysR family transcriptional regulator [Limosilactobacillus gastricus]|uniref:LysR family transcriptional regulator n=1 Tax=Limosilactobacillus gastricus TaxID=227942 RepID=UPI0026EE1CFE|nr:LysR family transcriptional regulator [Limosilactobacillus gastricus]